MKKKLLILFVLAIASSSLPSPEFVALGLSGRLKGYEILGFSKEPSRNDLTKSFNTLALKWHPDKNHNPNANAVFLLITAAKDSPNKIFYSNEEQAAQNYRTTAGDFDITISKSDVLRVLKVLLVGCSFICLFETYKFIKNMKNKDAVQNKKEASCKDNQKNV